MITVIKDQPIKLALDSKVLNKVIHKDQYQMPNIDMLIDTISQHITNTQFGQQQYFTTLDSKYAYSQLKLHHDTAKHFNFSIICGESTGKHRFKTGFYGPTDMPAEIQKAMDYTLLGLQHTYCFLDDIIIVSTGTETDHLAYVTVCLEKLDENNLGINLQKCHFAKTEIDWLGYKFNQTVISPLETKTAAILAIPPPKTLKRLRSFLGSLYYIGKFIDHLEHLKPINGIKSNNPPKYRKLSAITQIPKYKYNLQKNHSLFAQSIFTFHSTLSNPIKSLNANNSVNLLNKMPKTKATRSKFTPTKARVTFSDTNPSTPTTNTSSKNETPSGSLIDAAEDICFTETLNIMFSKKTTGHSHRKECNSHRSARLCHTRRP